MSELKPLTGDKTLYRLIPDTNDNNHGIMESRTSDSGSDNMNDKYITKEAFKQFEKRIDDKLDSLPDRMADKMDAKISGLEARQTKWFVGIAISTAIGGLSLIVGAIGLIVNIFI